MACCEFPDDANYFRIDNTTGKLTTLLPIMANATCMLAFQIKVGDQRLNGSSSSVLMAIPHSYGSLA